MTLTELLRERLRGEVDDAPRRRAEYASDASNYRVVPAVVAFPRDADDIAAALEVCRETGTPLTMRGGGTSVAGNAVGSGVVLDTTRHLTRVLEVDPEARTARVEPGVVLDDVQVLARAHGLRFGPDPSTHSRATFGGTIANNSCGAHALSFGRTDDNVVALEVLTGSGAHLELVSGLPHGVPEVDAAVAGSLGPIRTELGRFGRQVSGYALQHLLPENGSDLTRALVGSEGTCALTLQATVRLVEEPVATALAVLGYPDMASAADAVPGLLPHAPLALEGLDARLVDVIRRRKGAEAVPDLPRGGGWLLVEAGGATEAEAEAAARRMCRDAGALDVTVATGAKARMLWRIREDGAGLAGRTPDNQPAWPGWEDAAVPPERLGAYLRDFDGLMAEHRLDGLAYGHFGDGCVHVRIDFPLAAAPSEFRAFLLDAGALVASHGGSMSGEHGDGRARSELLPLMYSPEALGAFAAFKHALDPEGLLNPGVLVDPRPLDADLRRPAARPLRRGLAFALAEDAGDLTNAVHRCVGIGKCRADSSAAGGFMCPSWLVTRDEKDSTRGRARVLQELAVGGLVDSFSSPAVHESLDLCLSCKACAADCPAGVDMATYKAEVLHQKYRRRLRPVSHYTLGWLPRWAALAGRAPGLVNAISARLPARARRAAGLDERRSLPRFARGVRSASAPPDALSPEPAERLPVLLWVDTFSAAFSPDAVTAATRVLEGAGYAVHLPARRTCCGLTWITTGQLEAARRQLRRTLDVLAPALDGGWPIVGLEPSCTGVLREDIAHLLPHDPRAARVVTATRTLAELLTEAQAAGRWTPPQLSGTAVLAQPHCHHHAVMGWAADRALLAATGATLTEISGCCGLAGNWGVEQGHYDVSVAIAERALLPAVRALPEGGVVLADGFSCRTQLQDLAAQPAVTLAELLDRA